jgi:hypothetical protein
MPLLSVLDIHRLIEQDVQNLGFYLYDHLETEEVDLHINRQVYMLIDGILDKHFGRSLKLGPQQGFQVDQISLDNLRKQQVKGATTTLTAFDRGMKFDLPIAGDIYYHYTRATATISIACIDDNGQSVTKTDYSQLRIVENKNIDEMLKSPFHKTDKDSPLAEISGNTIYIYTSSDFTITNIKLDYIKRPAKIVYGKDGGGNYSDGASTQCDLDDSLHYMLQQMTSNSIMKIIENPQQKIVNLQQEIV